MVADSTRSFSSANATELAAPRSVLVRVLLIVGPPLVWLAAVFLSRTNVSLFFALAREDGPIETAEAIVLAVACFISGCIAWRLHSQNQWRFAAIYTALTLLLFLVAAEEISWGQRIFGIATPEWFMEHNKQKETTLHNLKAAKLIIAVLSRAAPVLLVTICALSTRIARRIPEKWRAFLWLPHPTLLSAWLCYLAYWVMRTHFSLTHPEAGKPTQILDTLQEPSELMVYVGVLAFVTLVWMRLRRDASARSPSR